MLLHLLATEIVTVDPQSTLPGGNTTQNFVNGITFFAVAFAVVGLVLSGGLWAVGAFSNNYTQSVNGKKGFLVCAAAALAIGAANILVTYFFSAGQSADAGDPAA